MSHGSLVGGAHTKLLLVIDFYEIKYSGVERSVDELVEVVMYEMWGSEREKGRMDC